MLAILCRRSGQSQQPDRKLALSGSFSWLRYGGGVDPLLVVALVVALVAVTTGIGILLKRSEGKVRAVDGPRMHPSVAERETWAERATVVQFSSPTCARCPSTARLLKEIAADLSPNPGDVEHVEIDIAASPELAGEWGILQTPTVFFLDGYGRVTARIGGPPKRHDVELNITHILRSPRADYSI